MEADLVRLSDGSEIGAKTLVVSAGLSPQKLVFDMIGTRAHGGGA